jgi:hypothetical protein
MIFGVTCHFTRMFQHAHGIFFALLPVTRYSNPSNRLALRVLLPHYLPELDTT